MIRVSVRARTPSEWYHFDFIKNPQSVSALAVYLAEMHPNAPVFVTMRSCRDVVRQTFPHAQFVAPDVLIDDLLVAPLIVVAGPYYAFVGNRPEPRFARDVRIAKAEMSVNVAGRGVSIRPGDAVDLNELPRDAVREDLFEPKVDLLATEC